MKLKSIVDGIVRVSVGHLPSLKFTDEEKVVEVMGHEVQAFVDAAAGKLVILCDHCVEEFKTVESYLKHLEG